MIPTTFTWMSRERHKQNCITKRLTSRDGRVYNAQSSFNKVRDCVKDASHYTDVMRVAGKVLSNVLSTLVQGLIAC